MPKQRTHSKVLELRGAFKKNPQRARHGEPEPKAGIGQAPSVLNTEAAAVWDEIVAAAPPGVLGDSDRVALELTVDLLIRHRKGEATSGERSQLLTLLGKLGLTPSDRCRLSIPGKPDPAGWDEF